jgi:hypothetical protein
VQLLLSQMKKIGVCNDLRTTSALGLLIVQLPINLSSEPEGADKVNEPRYDCGLLNCSHA